MVENTKPLSILILNQNWFVEELRELGHRVLSIGWTDDKNDLKFGCPSISIQEIFDLLPKAFSPDVLIYMDDSGPLSVIGLEELEIPTLFYSVDAHHHVSWHQQLAGAFDYNLVAQRVFLPKFQQTNQRSAWFPLWASQTIEPEEPKTIDVCFRGNLDKKLHPERAEFFEKLSDITPVDAKTGNYMAAFPKAKIVVNQAVKNDLNFRVFESMMCGAMLVTPDSTDGLLELFKDGVELVTYKDGDEQDAANKINYYLEHDEERVRIAKSGRKKVLEQHTKKARAKQLEAIIKQMKVTEKPRKFISSAAALYVASRKARKLSDALADRFLEHSVRCLIESAKIREVMDNAYLTTLHYCKYDFERRGRRDESLSLIREVFNYYYDEMVIGLSLVESLLHYDEKEEAQEILAKFTDDPQQMIAEIPNVLQPIRKEILGQLAKDSEVDRLEREKTDPES